MVHQSQLFDEDDDGVLIPNIFDMPQDNRHHETHIIQETSRQSYHDLISHPMELTGRHKEYIDALRDMGRAATDQEVSRFAGHNDPNYFRPRRNELVKMGLIVEVEKRICSVSGKTAITWWIK